MSAGRQGPTRAKDFENLNKEARNTKRRRCDDFALPSSRPSGVPPTENKRVTSDEMQEEIIPFDIRQRSTEGKCSFWSSLSFIKSLTCCLGCVMSSSSSC